MSMTIRPMMKAIEEGGDDRLKFANEGYRQAAEDEMMGRRMQQQSRMQASHEEAASRRQDSRDLNMLKIQAQRDTAAENRAQIAAQAAEVRAQLAANALIQKQTDANNAQWDKVKAAEEMRAYEIMMRDGFMPDVKSENNKGKTHAENLKGYYKFLDERKTEKTGNAEAVLGGLEAALEKNRQEADDAIKLHGKAFATTAETFGTSMFRKNLGEDEEKRVALIQKAHPGMSLLAAMNSMSEGERRKGDDALIQKLSDAISVHGVVNAKSVHGESPNLKSFNDRRLALENDYSNLTKTELGQAAAFNRATKKGKDAADQVAYDKFWEEDDKFWIPREVPPTEAETMAAAAKAAAINPGAVINPGAPQPEWSGAVPNAINFLGDAASGINATFGERMQAAGVRRNNDWNGIKRWLSPVISPPGGYNYQTNAVPDPSAALPLRLTPQQIADRNERLKIRRRELDFGPATLPMDVPGTFQYDER